MNERRAKKKKKKVTGAKAVRESQLIYMPQRISVLTALPSVSLPPRISARERPPRHREDSLHFSISAETEPSRRHEGF